MQLLKVILVISAATFILFRMLMFTVTLPFQSAVKEAD